MYVMSSLPPSQQSIAGGIFNTINKLCHNLGLGIATSVSSSVANRMTASTPAIQPYLAVYWFCAASAGLSLVMIPFLKLGTQGNAEPESDKKVQVTTDGCSERTSVTAADLKMTGAAGTVLSPAVEISDEKR